MMMMMMTMMLMMMLMMMRMRMMMMKMTQMKLVNSGTKFRPGMDKLSQPNSGGPQFQKRARGYIYIYNIYIYIFFYIYIYLYIYMCVYYIYTYIYIAGKTVQHHPPNQLELVVQTIPSYSPLALLNSLRRRWRGREKPFPNGWFIVLPTLYNYLCFTYHDLLCNN